MEIQVKRQDSAFLFEAESSTGTIVKMDASPEIGGSNKGARPMELILMSIAGCSGIDIALILKKQRVVIDEFNISVTAERRQEKPSVFEEIHVHYKVKGNVSHEQLNKAIELSMTKYCSATAQLKPSARITYSCEII